MRILDWIHEGIAPDPAGRNHSVTWQAIFSPPVSPTGAVSLGIAIGFFTTLIVFGWGLLLAGLLYVASDESMAAWLLTALSLAAGHAMLAFLCWHYALRVWRISESPSRAKDRQLGR